MEVLTKVRSIFLLLCIGFLAINAIVCLIRTVLGPRLADRIVCINVIGTKSIIIIALLSFFTGEGYLLDVAMVYAMISFLAVVVLSKCYLRPEHVNPIDPEHVFHKGKAPGTKEYDEYDDDEIVEEEVQ